MIDKRKSSVSTPVSFFLDLLGVALAYYLAFSIRFSEFLNLNSKNFQSYFSTLVLILVVWFVLYLVFQLHQENQGRGLFENLEKVILAKIILIGALSLYLVAIKGHFISRKFLVLFVLLDLTLSVALHTGYYCFTIRYRKRGEACRNVLFVGNLPSDDRQPPIPRFSYRHGYRILKILNLDDIIESIIFVLGEEFKTGHYDMLLISNPTRLGKALNPVINLAENYGLRVSIYPDFISSLKNKIDINYIGQIPFINIRNEPLRSMPNRMVKRVFDLVFALSVMVTFYWWFYLIAGMMIKLNSRGPVLFRQKRVGINEKIFFCYKFRTMRVMDREVSDITQKNDQRITWSGRKLRRTNLDEIPQILNVIRGEMSVVGPRPHMLEEDLHIRKKVPNYMVRQFIKPGMTGWAAVNGYRGGTRNIEKMKQRINHDIFYIENWSLWLDIKIMFQTLWQMVTFNNPNAY